MNLSHYDVSDVSGLRPKLILAWMTEIRKGQITTASLANSKLLLDRAKGNNMPQFFHKVMATQVNLLLMPVWTERKDIFGGLKL